MKHLFTIVSFLFFCLRSAQRQLTIPPSGGNKKAAVSERIAITDITLHYDHPLSGGPLS